MDPDAALAIIRERIAQYRRDMDSLHDDEDMSVDTIDALESVAHYAEALIEWLDKGGFLPAAWAKRLSIDPGQWPDFTPDGGSFCHAQDPVSGHVHAPPPRRRHHARRRHRQAHRRHLGLVD